MSDVLIGTVLRASICYLDWLVKQCRMLSDISEKSRQSASQCSLTLAHTSHV